MATSDPTMIISEVTDINSIPSEQLGWKAKATQEYWRTKNEKVDVHTDLMMLSAEQLVENLKRIGIPAKMQHIRCRVYQPSVEIDGVKFVPSIHLGGFSTVAVSGKCPVCGGECQSKALFTLADIGREIVSFTPDATHFVNCSRDRRSSRLYVSEW